MMYKMNISFDPNQKPTYLNNRLDSFKFSDLPPTTQDSLQKRFMNKIQEGGDYMIKPVYSPQVIGKQM